MPGIKVYKASAGSGKTEALSKEYIKMLLKTDLSDTEKFRRVLAVTFTNKATAEMKGRIVELLFKISKESTPQDVAGVMVTPEKAKSLLCAILHNYSYFRVSTIDKFFQLIIRAFVQELGLSANYLVELDEGQVISDTITDILLKIDDDEYKIFFQWFYNNLISAAEEGEDMKLRTLRRNLESFSHQIFNARYAEIKSLMPDAATYTAEIKKHKQRRSAILGLFKSMANEFKENLDKEPFTEDDYARGSFTPILSVLSKGGYPEINKTLPKWLEKACPKKDSDKAEAIEDAYNRWMHRLISDFIDAAEKHCAEFNTCSLIVKNAPYFLLFNELEAEIRRHTQSENTQLLSSSSEFINRIVDGSETPFIYEKTGTFIDNYLIDEFQDTSRLQWNNFQPLIKESLSNGMDNLIVGDVKQSIYRFRDSDWSILDSGVSGCFKTDSEVLEHNYRSLGNIIEYNNDLFKRLSDFIQTKYNALANRTDHTISDAYKDVCQQIPVPRPDTDDKDVTGYGYVSINPVTDCKNREEYEDAVFNKVIEDIKELREKGYKLSDIGVIYRWRKGAISLAQFLIKNGINVISEEALLIASNFAVCDITAILTNIVNSDDKASLYILDKYYKKELACGVEELSKLPLYELIEQIIFLCGMDREPSNLPYLNAFRDLVSDYISRNGSNLKEFLDWWNEVKEKQALTTSATADAVNIITLHKSKGLAFKAVIIPEMNWDFKANKQAVEILWEKIPASAPEYSALKCVPIEYGPAMRDSIFSEAYYNEVLLQYIDNLNLLYVAFTRARYVLIGYCNQPKKVPDYQKVISSIFPFFNNDVEANIGEIPDPAYFDKNSNNKQEESKESKEPKVLKESKESEELKELEELSPAAKMALFPLRDADGLTKQIERGSRMHRVMENVITVDDIEPQIEDMLLKGYIDRSQYEGLVKDLTEYVRKAPKEWFDGQKRVVAERTIIDVFTDKDGKTHKMEKRPDRVLIDRNSDQVTVVDYKFGEMKDAKHIAQVRGYMDLYKAAGHKSVTGYIYYFEGFEIVKVG